MLPPLLRPRAVPRAALCKPLCRAATKTRQNQPADSEATLEPGPALNQTALAWSKSNQFDVETSTSSNFSGWLQDDIAVLVGGRH